MINLKNYVKENWGSPFIVGFMLLLIVAAISLSAGLSSFANTFALYAYYALAAGVFLQLAGFAKNRGKRAVDEVAV
jgi:low affinity Fe/Cu permease